MHMYVANILAGGKRNFATLASGAHLTYEQV